MLVKKWNYTDEGVWITKKCLWLHNYVSSEIPNVVMLYEQHHVSDHDQKLNDSKILFSAV